MRHKGYSRCWVYLEAAETSANDTIVITGLAKLFRARLRVAYPSVVSSIVSHAVRRHQCKRLPINSRELNVALATEEMYYVHSNRDSCQPLTSSGAVTI